MKVVDSSNGGGSTLEDGTSAVTIGATLSLESLDFNTINSDTVFSIVAGNFNYQNTLGNAVGTGGKLDLQKGSALFNYSTISSDVVKVKISQEAFPQKNTSVKFGTVSLSWDAKKKLLAVKISMKVTAKLSDNNLAFPSNIICKKDDNRTYDGSDTMVLVQIEFGAAHSWLAAPMVGVAKTGDSGPDFATTATAKCKSATGTGTGTPP